MNSLLKNAFEGQPSKSFTSPSVKRVWTFFILLMISIYVHAGPGDITGPSCIEVDQTAFYSLEPEFPNHGFIEWWSDVDSVVVVDPLDRTKVSITPTPRNPTYVVLTAGVNYNHAPWYKKYSITIQIGCASKREGIQGPECVEENKEYDLFVIAPYNGYTAISWSLDVQGTVNVDPNNPAYATLRAGNTNASTATITTAITYADASRNKTFASTIDLGGCVSTEPGIKGPSCAEPEQSYSFKVVPSESNYTNIMWSSTGDVTLVPDTADATNVSVTYHSGSPGSVTLTAVVSYSDASQNETFDKILKVGGCNPSDVVITGAPCIDPLETFIYEVTPTTQDFVSITWSSTGNVTITQDPTDPTKVTVEYERGNPSSVVLTAVIEYEDPLQNESGELAIQVGGCNPVAPVITGTDCADLSKTYLFTVTPSNKNYSDITWSGSGNVTIVQDPTDPAKATVSYATANPSVTLTADIAYVDTTMNESIQKTLKAGNCVAANPGIIGPACVEPGVPYTYILTPEQTDHYWIDWWTNADATIVKDINDPRKVTVTFTNNNIPGSVFTLTAGVDFSSAPWWKKYNLQVKVGGCASPTEVISPIVLAPHPFAEEAILSLVTGEEIISVKVVDGNGMEVLHMDNVNASQVKIGHLLNPGLFSVQIITNAGVYSDLFIKGGK